MTRFTHIGSFCKYMGDMIDVQLRLFLVCWFFKALDEINEAKYSAESERTFLSGIRRLSVHLNIRTSLRGTSSWTSSSTTWGK